MMSMTLDDDVYELDDDVCNLQDDNVYELDDDVCNLQDDDVYDARR